MYGARKKFVLAANGPATFVALKIVYVCAPGYGVKRRLFCGPDEIMLSMSGGGGSDAVRLLVRTKPSETKAQWKTKYFMITALMRPYHATLARRCQASSTNSSGKLCGWASPAHGNSAGQQSDALRIVFSAARVATGVHD